MRGDKKCNLAGLPGAFHDCNVGHQIPKAISNRQHCQAQNVGGYAPHDAQSLQNRHHLRRRNMLEDWFAVARSTKNFLFLALDLVSDEIQPGDGTDKSCNSQEGCKLGAQGLLPNQQAGKDQQY